MGLGLRAAWRPPRATAFGPSTRLLEVAAAADGWAAFGPLVARAGAGLAARRWSLDTDPVAAHVVPQAVLGLAVPVAVGGWRISAGVAGEIDLATTHIGWSTADERLSPAAIRLDLRLGAADRAGSAAPAKNIEPGPSAATSAGTPKPDEVTP
ncbi:MAG: hypothetical protein R3F59_17045 [Myxococcota bacterium]